MKSGFMKFTEKLKKARDSDEDYFDDEATEEYVEIDGAESGPRDFKSKVLVRPFIIRDFGDIKETLDSLREGYTIALVNIKPLKEKDLVELKRAINKLKKTTDALEGDIAGFGDNWIAAVPSFAHIHRHKVKEETETKETLSDVSEYD